MTPLLVAALAPAVLLASGELLAPLVAGAPQRATVPALAVGPDDLARAPEAQLPLSGVVVFPGRARLSRSGRVPLDAGLRLLQLEGLPANTDPRSVRVAAEGARVLRSSGEVVERLRPALAEVEARLRKIEALVEARARLEVELEAERDRLARWRALRPVDLPAERHRRGPALPAGPEAWGAAVGFVRGELRGAQARVRRLEARAAEFEREKAALASEVTTLEAGGLIGRAYRVSLVLDVPKARPVALELRYEVPGPTWSPSYRLRWRPELSKVDIEMSAEIAQATGEDWRGVDLTVSTAVPSARLVVPELQTWVLGEAEDLELEPRPARPPPSPRPPSWPGLRPTEAELGRAERLDAYYALRARHLGRSSRRAKKEAKGSSPSAPPAPRDDAASPPRAADIDVISEHVEATGSLLGASRDERRRTTLGLFERAAPAVRFAPGLPTEARGADLRYRARARVPVASGAGAIRVPLFVESLEVEPRHRATPSLDSAAFLRAELENTTGRPWLAGPMRIFVGDASVGAARLETTGPGGTLELPLGRDERIEVARRVVSSRDASGFLGQTRVQRFDVTLEIVSHLDRPTVIELLEPVPVSGSSDVKVRLERSNPEPVQTKDMQDGLPRSGVLEYQVEVSAQGKREISLRYVIEHPKDVRVMQR